MRASNALVPDRCHEVVLECGLRVDDAGEPGANRAQVVCCGDLLAAVRPIDAVATVKIGRLCVAPGSASPGNAAPPVASR